MKYISSEGLQRLKDELKERQTTKRQEIARRLEEAKTLGDLSENSEWQSAKEAQAFNEGKIAELEEVIKKSVIIQSGRNRQRKVQIGTTIEVKLMDGSRSGGTKRILTIVGSEESNPLQGKISNESPLGRAFLDCEKGDIVEIDTPKGKMRYKIVEVK